MARPTSLPGRKQMEKLRAEGTDLLQTQNGILFEATKWMGIALLDALDRCAVGPFQPQTDPDREQRTMCCCEKCEAARRMLHRELDAVAVSKYALDAFMAKVGRQTGRTIRPVPE